MCFKNLKSYTSYNYFSSIQSGLLESHSYCYQNCYVIPYHQKVGDRDTFTIIDNIRQIIQGFKKRQIYFFNINFEHILHAKSVSFYTLQNRQNSPHSTAIHIHTKIKSPFLCMLWDVMRNSAQQYMSYNYKVFLLFLLPFFLVCKYSNLIRFSVQNSIIGNIKASKMLTLYLQNRYYIARKNQE